MPNALDPRVPHVTEKGYICYTEGEEFSNSVVKRLFN